MKTVFYSKDASFNLTDEEFKDFIEKASGKKVWIPRLCVFLSDMFIWAGERPLDENKRTLSDGTKIIKFFGRWVLESNNSIRVDLSCYPELAKDLTDKKIKQLK
jgi:hypothetical protein